MSRKGFLLAAIGSLFLLPVASRAAVEHPFEVTIGGGASHSPDLDGFTGSINGSLGYYFTDNLELSVRQSVEYSDLGNSGAGGSAWDGSTRAAVDLHFPLGDHGEIQPFIGANLGYVYGQTVSDTWEAAPEAGVKFYVTPSTFIFVEVEYQFFFKHGEVEGGFNNGEFVYTIGLGFRF